jgi:hypothetical protein
MHFVIQVIFAARRVSYGEPAIIASFKLLIGTAWALAATVDCVCLLHCLTHSATQCAILFSIRRSGTSQAIATKTYSPYAIHEFRNASGIATK